MTNEEAIERMEDLRLGREISLNINKDEATLKLCNDDIDWANYVIKVLEGNTKLKAEIERLREYIENQKKLYEYRIDLQLEYSDRNHEEIEKLKELMPKICETCEYEDEIGYEEPCNSCNNSKNWKLKGEE